MTLFITNVILKMSKGDEFMLDKMFQDLKTLEYFYNEGYITLTEYLKIKSNICDLAMKKFENEKDNGDLPF